MTLQHHFPWASPSTLKHTGRSCVTSIVGKHVLTRAGTRTHTQTHTHTHTQWDTPLGLAISSAVQPLEGNCGMQGPALATGIAARGIPELLRVGFCTKCGVGPEGGQPSPGLQLPGEKTAGSKSLARSV